MPCLRSCGALHFHVGPTLFCHLHTVCLLLTGERGGSQVLDLLSLLQGRRHASVWSCRPFRTRGRRGNGWRTPLNRPLFTRTWSQRRIDRHSSFLLAAGAMQQAETSTWERFAFRNGARTSLGLVSDCITKRWQGLLQVLECASAAPAAVGPVRRLSSRSNGCSF